MAELILAPDKPGRGQYPLDLTMRQISASSGFTQSSPVSMSFQELIIMTGLDTKSTSSTHDPDLTMSPQAPSSSRNSTNYDARVSFNTLEDFVKMMGLSPTRSLGFSRSPVRSGSVSSPGQHLSPSDGQHLSPLLYPSDGPGCDSYVCRLRRLASERAQ